MSISDPQASPSVPPRGLSPILGFSSPNQVPFISKFPCKALFSQTRAWPQAGVPTGLNG